jgi:hypothetical protein
MSSHGVPAARSDKGEASGVGHGSAASTPHVLRRHDAQRRATPINWLTAPKGGTTTSHPREETGKCYAPVPRARLVAR